MAHSHPRFIVVGDSEVVEKMEDAFLALSTAYAGRKKAGDAIAEARLRGQIDIHVACFDAQQRDDGFASERLEMEAQLHELSSSIAALDKVRASSSDDSKQDINRVRMAAHAAIHTACIDSQTAEASVQEALDTFDREFAKKSIHSRAEIARKAKDVEAAGVALTATRLVFDKASLTHDDAKRAYEAANDAHAAATAVQTALENLAREAESFDEI